MLKTVELGMDVNLVSNSFAGLKDYLWAKCGPEPQNTRSSSGDQAQAQDRMQEGFRDLHIEAHCMSRLQHAVSGRRRILSKETRTSSSRGFQLAFRA